MTIFSLLLLSLMVLAATRSTETQGSKKKVPEVYNGLQGSIPRTFYTASWAIEITEGGAKMADVIARRNGFTNLGEVSYFQQYS